MANFGGFYKGEKKKPKKGGTPKNVSSVSSTFTMPQIIGKKRRE